MNSTTVKNVFIAGGLGVLVAGIAFGRLQDKKSIASLVKALVVVL